MLSTYIGNRAFNIKIPDNRYPPSQGKAPLLTAPDYQNQAGYAAEHADNGGKIIFFFPF